MPEIDLSEPIPIEVWPADPNYLAGVELYLVSKYQPEFYESTIFKIRSAAFKREKLMKEHHVVLPDLQSLGDELTRDLSTIQWTPKRSGRHATGRSRERPGIGNAYQQELDRI